MFKILLIFHLLGSAVWVGGHVILCFTILPKALRLRDTELISAFESRFEKIGVPALLVQVLTGIWLAHFYLNSVFDAFRFSDSLQTLIALKLILLLATLVIAAHARLRLINKLNEHNLTYLAWHITSVTVLGLVLLILGAGIRSGGF